MIFFGNIFVNDYEQLLRMKDSFNSHDVRFFKEIRINIRGNYKNEAADFFVSKKLSNIFQINSNYGWFHDSFQILKNTTSKYVFLWLEDFICVDQKSFRKYILSVQENKMDIARYAFKKDLISQFYSNKIIYEDFISFGKNLNKNEYKNISHFIISYGSIINKQLMFRVLTSTTPNIWSKFTPFGFEKDSNQTEWLPLKASFLKKEIILSIDDDHDEPNSSLQSKGLYPIRTKKRNNSFHLRKYLEYGKQYKIKFFLKIIINLIKLVILALYKKISIMLFTKLIKNINQIEISSKNLALLKFIDTNKEDCNIFTLDNKFAEIKYFFKNKKIDIITNAIFNKSKREQIILTPLQYRALKHKHNNIIYGGYQLDQFVHIKSIDDKNYIFHDLIYNSLNERQKSILKNKKVFTFN